jgi:hypothetical protein
LQPVKIGSHDEVIKQMSANNTKVEVYTEKAKTHTFYVSKVAAPNNLTYMLTEGAKRPYIVKLPLQNIFLGLRYSTEMRDWRSKKIMRAKADEIEMIDVAYKDSTQYSFHLVHEKDKVPVVTGLQPSTKPLNIKRVQSYLRLWDSIYCLGFEARNRIKDTLLTEGKEVATVRMKKANHALQTLTIYFKPVSKGTKGMFKVGNEEFDFLISSMPIDNFLRIFKSTNTSILKSIPSLFFRNTIIVYVQLNKTNLFKDQWLYIQDENILTGRVTNFNNWVPDIIGDKKDTVLALEYWCYEMDSIWALEKKSFSEIISKDLLNCGFIDERNEILDFEVIRIPKCYPVYKDDYKIHLEKIQNFI